MSYTIGENKYRVGGKDFCGNGYRCSMCLSADSMWNKRKYKFVRENPYNQRRLDGLGMLICCEWNDSFVKIINDKNIKHLFLNYSFGWKCSDYAFLEDMQLETLEIVDVHSKGIRSVEKQKDLKTLSLNVPDADDVDFRVFYNLKNVFCYGRKRNDTLFSCCSIENLYVDDFKIGDEHGIGNLKNLKHLTVANSNITSLSFVRNLVLLENLTILNCKKLQSFSDISYLQKLKRIDIRGVKGLHDIEFLSNLSNMEVVIIETDRLVSIKPLADLRNISALALFGGNFVIDDMDLTPVNGLKRLSMLDIPNRRCYPVTINNRWNWNDYGNSREKWLTEKQRKP